METFVHELQSATDFVRQLFADRQINLDYSLQSVGHLDELFEHEFKQGEPTNPDGTFAQYQGLIMTGVSGYPGCPKLYYRFSEHAMTSEFTSSPRKAPSKARPLWILG